MEQLDAEVLRESERVEPAREAADREAAAAKRKGTF